MAQIVAKTPLATIVQQDDGTVLTMPPSFELGPAPGDPAPPPSAPPIAPPSFVPPDSPVPAIAQGMPAPPAPTPVDASPSVPAPVDVSAAPVATPPPEPMPAEAPPAVDAVSGGGEAAPIDPYTAAADVIAPPAPLPTTQQVVEETAIDRANAAGALAAKQAEERAGLMADAQRRALELEDLRAKAAAKIADHRATVQAAADKAVEDYVNADMKPAEKNNAGNVLALIFGGIGNVLMNNGAGANPVLGIIERKADAAARDRAEKLKRLGSNVDMRNRQVDSLSAWAKDSDAYYNAAKAAELENYARQIEVAASGYDSPREQLKAKEMVAQIRAQAEAAKVAAADAEHKRQVEAAELQLKFAKQATDEYQAQTSRKQVGLGYANLGENRRQFNEQFKAAQEQRDFDNGMKLKNLDLEIQKAEKEGRSKDVTALREQREAETHDAARRIGVMPVTIKDDQGRPVGVEWQEFKNADGVAFRANDATRAKELTSKMAATNEAVGLLDRLIRMREKYGWSSSTLKSAEFQQMKADYGRLLLVAKDEGGLGALSGPDMGLIHSVLGTDDPTEVRDPGAGLSQARQNMVRSFDTALRANGYTGNAFEIPDVATAAGAQSAAKNTPEQAAAQDLSASLRSGSPAHAPVLSDKRPRLGLFEESRLAPLVNVAVSGKSDAANASIASIVDDGNFLATAAAANMVDPGWSYAEDREARIDAIGRRLLGKYATDERLAAFRKDNLGAAQAPIPSPDAVKSLIRPPSGAAPGAR